MTRAPAEAEADDRYMSRALELARRAESAGEVPVGAVAVHEGTVVGEGWNSPVARDDPSAHAEILALREAGERLGNYRLPGTALYVTLEPCPMCAGAIVQARLEALVYGAADPKSGAAGSVLDLLSGGTLNHRVACRGGIMAEQCGALLTSFFERRRGSHR